MLGDIKSARKLLSGLDADDMENLGECVKAANELTPLAETISDLSEALNNRIEYLKAAGQTIEEEEDGTGEEVTM